MIKLTITTVELVGRAARYETMSPNTKAIIDTSVAQIMTALKDLANCMAVIVGKMMRLEISNAPRSLMPSTMTIEQIMAKMMS